MLDPEPVGEEPDEAVGQHRVAQLADDLEHGVGRGAAGVEVGAGARGLRLDQQLDQRPGGYTFYLPEHYYFFEGTGLAGGMVRNPRLKPEACA